MLSYFCHLYLLIFKYEGYTIFVVRGNFPTVQSSIGLSESDRGNWMIVEKSGTKKFAPQRSEVRTYNTPNKNNNNKKKRESVISLSLLTKENRSLPPSTKLSIS